MKIPARLKAAPLVLYEGKSQILGLASYKLSQTFIHILNCRYPASAKLVKHPGQVPSAMQMIY
jgi:hypothetical protein